MSTSETFLCANYRNESGGQRTANQIWPHLHHCAENGDRPAGVDLAEATGSGNRFVSSFLFISYSLRRPTDISNITSDGRCHLPLEAMAQADYSASVVFKCQATPESPLMLFENQISNPQPFKTPVQEGCTCNRPVGVEPQRTPGPCFKL